MPEQSPKTYTREFHEVLAYELEQVKERRRQLKIDTMKPTESYLDSTRYLEDWFVSRRDKLQADIERLKDLIRDAGFEADGLRKQQILDITQQQLAITESLLSDLETHVMQLLASNSSHVSRGWAADSPSNYKEPCGCSS